MLRKHINAMPRLLIKDLPFHSWNCITIQLPHRDIDLVIKCEESMRRLINFLVHRLRTIDGVRDSAVPLVEGFIEKGQQDDLTDGQRIDLRLAVEYRVYKEACLKCRVLTVRSKISFHAAYNLMTVPELILTRIFSLFYQMLAEGTAIKPDGLQ